MLSLVSLMLGSFQARCWRFDAEQPRLLLRVSEDESRQGGGRPRAAEVQKQRKSPQTFLDILQSTNTEVV